MFGYIGRFITIFLVVGFLTYFMLSSDDIMVNTRNITIVGITILLLIIGFLATRKRKRN